MNLVKWDPFGDTSTLRNELNRWFSGNAGALSSPRAETWIPAVDILEDEKTITIKAELPDMDKKDVDVSVAEGVLTIKGERKLEKEEKKENFRRIERSHGSFFRSFNLPDYVDEKGVAAQYDKGVLRVTLPKSKAVQRKEFKVPVG